MKIIAFCGRKGSGKTLLSKQILRYGFEKISFADELRDLVSQLFGWSTEELSDPKIKEQVLPKPIIWNNILAKKLGDLVGVKDLYSEETPLESRRKVLQFVGTEVLRRYDYDFHVKATEKRLVKDKNYVFDDVRFNNELNMIKRKGGVSIFIIRPHYAECSNHDSEIGLNRSMFNLVMINNCTEKMFIDKFNLFVNSFLNLHQDHNTDAFLGLNAKTAYWIGIFSVVGKIIKLSENNCFIRFESRSAKLLEELQSYLGISRKIVDYHLDGNYQFSFRSPYWLEDLKRWDITAKGCQDIPSCCLGSSKLLKSYEKGRKVAHALHKAGEQKEV